MQNLSVEVVLVLVRLVSICLQAYTPLTVWYSGLVIVESYSLKLLPFYLLC